MVWVSSMNAPVGVVELAVGVDESLAVGIAPESGSSRAFATAEDERAVLEEGVLGHDVAGVLVVVMTSAPRESAGLPVGQVEGDAFKLIAPHQGPRSAGGRGVHASRKEPEAKPDAEP